MADPPGQQEYPTLQTYKAGLKKWYKVIANYSVNTGLNDLPIIHAAIRKGTDFRDKVKFRTTEADFLSMLMHEMKIQSRFEKLPDKYDSDDSPAEEEEEMMQESEESEEDRNWARWQNLRQQRRAPLQMQLEILGLSTSTTFAKYRSEQSPLKIDLTLLLDEKFRYVLPNIRIALSFDKYPLKAEKDAQIPRELEVLMKFMNWPTGYGLISKLAGSRRQALKNRETFMRALGVFVLNGIDVYPEKKDIADYFRNFKITTDEDNDMTITFELGKKQEKDEKHYERGRRGNMYEYPVFDVSWLTGACIYMLSEAELNFCDDNYSQLSNDRKHVFSWLYGPHYCHPKFYQSMATKIGLGDKYLQFEDLRQQIKEYLSKMQRLEKDNFLEDPDDEEFKPVWSPKSVEKMKRDGYDPDLPEPNVCCMASMRLSKNNEDGQSRELVQSEAKSFLTGKKRKAAEIETNNCDDVECDEIWSAVLKDMQGVEMQKTTRLQETIDHLQDDLNDSKIDKTKIASTKQDLQKQQQKLVQQRKRSEKLDVEVEFLNRQVQGCSWLMTDILQIIFSTILLFVVQKHYDDDSQSSEKHWTQHLLLLWADQYRIRAMAHLMKQVCKDIEIDDDGERHTLISMDQLIDAFSNSQLDDSTHAIAVPQRQGHETDDGTKAREDYVFNDVTEEELKHEEVKKLVTDLSFDLAPKEQERLNVRIKEELYGVYAKIHFNQNGGNGPLFHKDQKDGNIYASSQKVNRSKARSLCEAIFERADMVLPEDFQPYIEANVPDQEQFQLDVKTWSYGGIAALAMLCDARKLGKLVMRNKDLTEFMKEPDDDEETELPEDEVPWAITKDVLLSFISMIDLQSAFIFYVLQDVTLIMQKGFDWCQMHKEVTDNAKNMSDLDLTFQNLQTMLLIGPTENEVQSNGTETLTLHNSHLVFKEWSKHGFQDLQEDNCILKALTDMRDDASEQSESDYSDIEPEADSDGDGDSVDAELESDTEA